MFYVQIQFYALLCALAMYRFFPNGYTLREIAHPIVLWLANPSPSRVSYYRDENYFHFHTWNVIGYHLCTRKSLVATSYPLSLLLLIVLVTVV